MNFASTSESELRHLALAIKRLEFLEESERLEGSLIEFYKASWEVVDPAPYQHNWHLEAIAEHLEAVSYGHIRKLLINMPPRHSKTLLCSVAWNAWMWCKEADERYPLIGPAARFMCLSYGETLAMDNSILTQRLVSSDWYQKRWGHRVILTADQANKHKFDTTAGGTRISGSFQGTITGRGGSIRVYDDPHKMDEVESQVKREAVLKIYDTTLKSRITDPRTSAEVMVAQRGHQEDLSKKFLDDPITVHLNLPAEFEPERKCYTVLKYDDEGNPEVTWEDPRTKEGQLLWEGRWGPKELAVYKREQYEWSAQWQQMPIVRGGTIIKTEWWQLWDQDHFPACEYKWAFADTAYTENESNDPTGFTVWGLFYENGDPKVILLDAWRKRLELHAPNKWTEKDRTRAERQRRVESWIKASRSFYSKNEGGPEPIIGLDVEPWASYIEFGYNSIDPWPNEPKPIWEARTKDEWGLCEWLARSCQRFGVHKLIIEAKASGLSVGQELKRLHGSEGWGIETKPPKGDKHARLRAVQSIFSQGLVYAPDREWAQMVIDEVCAFPKGVHDDLTDSTSGALEHIREIGLLITRDQRLLENQQMAMYQRPTAPLYEV